MSTRTGIAVVVIAVGALLAALFLLRSAPATETSTGPAPVRAARAATSETASARAVMDEATKNALVGPTPMDAQRIGHPAARGSVLVDAAPARSPGSADAPASLDKEDVRAGIKAVTPKIRDCYERALKQQPDLGGKVIVKFTMEGKDGKGTVVSGEVAESETDSPFFDACVLKEVAGAEFKAPSGGGTINVTYPFVFANDPK